jgi:hypothetical protein
MPVVTAALPRPTASNECHRDDMIISATFTGAGNSRPLLRRVLAVAGFDVLVVSDHSPDSSREADTEGGSG